MNNFLNNVSLKIENPFKKSEIAIEIQDGGWSGEKDRSQPYWIWNQRRPVNENAEVR